MTTLGAARGLAAASPTRVDFAGSAFEVSLRRPSSPSSAGDRAVPGAEEAALVSVTSHPAVAPGPPDPARRCRTLDAAAGRRRSPSSARRRPGRRARFRVIGASRRGQPAAAHAARASSSARPTGACVGVSFQVASASSVLATWDGDAPGATCTAAFSVRDAQGRRTQRRARRSAPPRPAGLPQGARQRLSDRLRRRRAHPAGRPGRGRPRLPRADRVRHPLERVGGRAVLGGRLRARRSRRPTASERTYEAYRGQRRRRPRARVCVSDAWAYDSPAAPSQIQVRPVVTAVRAVSSR